MNLKFKDLFTVVTIVLGFAVVPLAARGRIELASVLIIVGAFFDLGDGFVARITGTQNKFGAEFDCIADLVVYSFAPAVLVFYCFESFNPWFAFGVAVFPLLFGCLRLARFNVKRIEFPGFWVGLPRPGAAAVIVSFLNTVLFERFDLFVVGSFIVVGSSVLCVTLVPFPGHHRRKLPKLFPVFVALIVLSVAVAAAFGLVWDILFVYSVGYVLSSPFVMSRGLKSEFRDFVRAWKAEESAGV